MEITVEEIDKNVNFYEYCNLLKQLTSINPDSFTEGQFMDHLKLIKSNPLHKIFLAKNNNEVIGSITVLIEPKFIHDLSSVAHIEDVVVKLNYRSYGIGQLLVNKAIEFVRNYGSYKIILDCSDKNVSFYKKFGFVVKENQMVLYLH